MKKVVVIHQPDFLPYLGFFHRFLHADVFVVLDDVQFIRRGWHHRDKIKTMQGDSWITIGLMKSSQDTKINNIMLSDNDWKEKHLNLFRQNYKKSEYFNEVFFYLEDLYSHNFKKMIDFNLASIDMLMKLFDIRIQIELSSRYDIATKANNLLVDLLKNTDATHYLSGVGAKDYFKNKPFDEENIKVIWQEFTHPVYPQLYGKFIPYLSSIDLLFNCGIKESRKILRGI